MEPLTIFLIAAVILLAAIGYVVLQVRHYGESQQAANKLLQIQTELETTKTKLQGYTKYADFLSTGKLAVAAMVKPVKLVRDYVHVERIPKDMLRIKADATIVVKYSLEFTLGIDLQPDTIELLEGSNGLGVKIPRPTLQAPPVIKSSSHEVTNGEGLPDIKGILADIHQKIAVTAKRYGNTVAAEEVVLALFKVKLAECFRDFLEKQPGVRHTPAVFAEYR